MNVCTITTRGGFGAACALIDSIRLHHRGASVVALILDDREHELDAAGLPFELLRPAELGISRFESLAAIHPEHELREVVKPALLRLALERFETVCYLDPSTHVYAPLDGLEDPTSAILVPRARTAIPDDGLRPSDADICMLGAYDTDCLAFRRERQVDELLCNWSKRMEGASSEEHDAIRAHWLDLLPSRLPNTRLLEDPGIAIAAWNAHECRLERRDDTWLVGDGLPLRLANFAGLGGDSGEWQVILADHRARALPDNFRYLFEQRERLVQACGGRREHREYGYARLADGTPLTQRLRHAVRRAEMIGRLHDSPFSLAGTRNLLDWLNEPMELGARAGISRFWLEIYSERLDLQLVHADLDGPGGAGFLDWIAAAGRDDYDVPRSLMPRGLRS